MNTSSLPMFRRYVGHEVQSTLQMIYSPKPANQPLNKIFNVNEAENIVHTHNNRQVIVFSEHN